MGPVFLALAVLAGLLSPFALSLAGVYAFSARRPAGVCHFPTRRRRGGVAGLLVALLAACFFAAGYFVGRGAL